MPGFVISGGIAEIHDPSIYENWLDNEEFKAAVAEAETPERTATKRLLIEFEADLARLVRDGSVAEHVVDVIERYVAEDYVQHDPNVPSGPVGGRPGLIEHFRRMPPGGPTPPPVVGVTLDGDLACVMMRELVLDPSEPTGTYEWTILTLFRTRGERLVEHWSAYRKMGPVPHLPPPDVVPAAAPEVLAPNGTD